VLRSASSNMNTAHSSHTHLLCCLVATGSRFILATRDGPTVG
jgi:hypothetical protein